MATQEFHSDVIINGGTIAGITDLAIADGGTGASTASAARTNLGLVIGTDVQAHSAALDTIAGQYGTTSVTTPTYTALVTDSTIIANDDTAGAVIDITLLTPAAAGDGFKQTFIKDGSTYAVNLIGTISDTVNLALLTKGDTITIQSNGSKWYQIA